MRVNEVAAAIHKRMADDDRFGYSWEERHGAFPETWEIGGGAYTVNVGDYDCSSSTRDAWKLALSKTAYAGCLDAATYTGNMRSVFVGSGLFEWKPMSFLAEPGDLYLNEANHVAMCQTQVPDVLSEFSWGDSGAYGNQSGDQSGWEASTHGYYDYPWDGILHYNGKADGTANDAPSQPAYAEPVQAAPDREWQGDVVGRSDTTGAGDDYAGVPGRPICNIAIDGVGAYAVSDIHHAGYWDEVSKYDLSDPERGFAGDDCPVDRLKIADPTVSYQLHELGGDWWPVMVGPRDTGGSSDDFAGDEGVQFDLVRIWRESGEQPRYNVYS